MPSLISIIIPVYNQEKELLFALSSIKKQTYRPLEVIVVDDGSKKALSSQRSVLNIPIKIIRQNNKGAPAARNRGFREAKGEYVIFWDADVIGEPRMITKMVQTLETDRQASFAYSNFYFGIKKMLARPFDVLALQPCNYIHSTSLIRGSDVILWDESLQRFQDWDLWLTMAKHGKVGVWINEYLFRLTTGGTMSAWLPSFAYKKPWRWLPGISQKVKSYEKAQSIIVQKHQL